MGLLQRLFLVSKLYCQYGTILQKEVIEFSPSLADKLARNTAINTVDEIADEIAELILNE